MRSVFSVLICMLFLSLNVGAQSWDLDTVKVGGIRQVIATRGVKNGPLILFLHGGPGSSRMKQADTFSGELQKHFLVVQWDQRQTGKTLALDTTDGKISLSLMFDDTREVIDYLLKKSGQKKIYLAGESWGTVLGFRMAERYPEKLYAYLAFAPVTNQAESEKLLLSKLLNDASTKNNSSAQNELLRVTIPFENSDQLYYLRKWWFNYEGHPFADKDTTLVKNYLKSWSDIWLPTWQAAMQRNLLTDLPVIQCPIYFFIGGKDYQTNGELAKVYYDKLIAAKKKLYWFENASHDLLVSDAPKVQRIIIDEILIK